ncbi:MAG: SIS domain-containing protein, partial [Candidatus Micrarchaeaceae archaeon]
PEEVKARFRIIDEILKDSGVEPVVAPYIGSSYLSKTFSMIYYLEYVTNYTAILRGVNPILTPSIDRLKSRLDAMGKGY